MTIKNAIASLAVRDIGTSRVWYEKVLAAPPTSTPMPELAEWQFERGGWLQLYQASERAGLGSLTLAVSSVDEQISDLRVLGLEPGLPIVSEKVKVVMIQDPDGNSIAFAEALDPSIAQ